MSTLYEAINASAITENGAKTNFSSMNKCCDLFYLAGASRGKDIKHVMASAFAEDQEVATRILMWTRDIRGGAGERQTFRDLFQYLISVDEKIAERVLVKIPEIGRFDDLFVAFGTKIEKSVLKIIAGQLNFGNAICAKWCPRQGDIANKIRKYLKLTPKEYRKMVVSLSNTVETKMCANEWEDIQYSFVPSIAAARYQKAFNKHDPKGYAEYKAGLVNGETKINASAIYPYDVIRSLRHGDTTVANQQWNALPDYLEGSTENILPVVDVSGSMSVNISGSVQAVDVAVSLGLYLSERSKGAFKDQFITFSESPRLQKVSGTLQDRYNQMSRAEWGMSTNIVSVFETILNAAKQFQVDEKEMPTTVLILSDMEFNRCITSGSDVSAIDMMKTLYTQAGYTLPKVVFWNLNSKSQTVPVKYNDVGTALVSGFSPSIVKSILSGAKDFDPINIMLNTVMIQRYDF